MQLVRLITGASAPYNAWSINIALFEIGRPAKTGLMDESITLDGVEWAFPLFENLVRGRSPRTRHWTFTVLDLSRRFREALVATGLGHLKTTLYASMPTATAGPAKNLCEAVGASTRSNIAGVGDHQPQ